MFDLVSFRESSDVRFAQEKGDPEPEEGREGTKKKTEMPIARGGSNPSAPKRKRVDEKASAKGGDEGDDELSEEVDSAEEELSGCDEDERLSDQEELDDGHEESERGATRQRGKDAGELDSKDNMDVGDEEDSLAESSEEEEDDLDAQVDLTGVTVCAFAPEGGSKAMGILTRKISSGSYGSVYRFEPRRGGRPTSQRATPNEDASEKRTGWVAKVTSVPEGFAPSDLLRECFAQVLLDGHPCAPKLPGEKDGRVGEVSMRDVRKRRRELFDEETLDRMENDAGKCASDRYLALVMSDAGDTLEGACEAAGTTPKSRFELLRDSLPGVLSVLSCLHSVKVAHRDIKLNNVLVRRPGEIDPSNGQESNPLAVATLIDYGLGKRLVRRNSKRIGALGYRCPETIDWDNPEYDVSIDLYAVGCCFLLALEPSIEDSEVTDDISTLKDAEIKAVRLLSKSRWKGASAWAKLLQSLLRTDPTARPSAESALCSLEKGGALPIGFFDAHRSWCAHFQSRARSLMLPDVRSLSESALKENGRDSALRLVAQVAKNLNQPKIVATRSMELLDAAFAKGLLDGPTGSRRLLVWRAAAASAFYLTAQYFEAGGDANPETVASEFRIAVAHLRTYHWKVVELLGWVVLRSSSHDRPPEDYGVVKLYDPARVAQARKARLLLP